METLLIDPWIERTRSSCLLPLSSIFSQDEDVYDLYRNRTGNITREEITKFYPLVDLPSVATADPRDFRVLFNEIILTINNTMVSARVLYVY